MARCITPVAFCFALLLSSSVQLLAAPSAQSHFFDVVATGDVSRVMSLMDESLQAQVDAPVLDAWIDAFNERLGPVTDLKTTGWTRKLSTNGIIAETSCDVTCQRGVAKSTLTFLNSKLIAFQINSEQLANFFEGPTSTDLYEELSNDFISKFLVGEADAAYALCHKGLQDVVSLDQLKEMINIVKPHVGQLSGTELTQSRMESTDTANKLILDFQIVGNEGNASCKMTIEFVGLKGHLLGFRFKLQ